MKKMLTTVIGLSCLALYLFCIFLTTKIDIQNIRWILANNTANRSTTGIVTKAESTNSVKVAGCDETYSYALDRRTYNKSFDSSGGICSDHRGEQIVIRYKASDPASGVLQTNGPIYKRMTWDLILSLIFYTPLVVVLYLLAIASIRQKLRKPGTWPRRS